MRRRKKGVLPADIAGIIINWASSVFLLQLNMQSI